MTNSFCARFLKICLYLPLIGKLWSFCPYLLRTYKLLGLAMSSILKDLPWLWRWPSWIFPVKIASLKTEKNLNLQLVYSHKISDLTTLRCVFSNSVERNTHYLIKYDWEWNILQPSFTARLEGLKNFTGKKPFKNIQYWMTHLSDTRRKVWHCQILSNIIECLFPKLWARRFT